MMEYYTTQATDVKNLWLQGLRELALRQVRERDMSKPQVRDFGKTLHGMWQHLVLQGWNQIFTPPPPSKETEAQQNPANEAAGINALNKGIEQPFSDENQYKEAPSKEIDDSESRVASVEVAENNQEIWAPFKGSSEIKRSEEAHEKQQKDAHSISEAEVWERSSLLGNGMEIRPEAPILRTELPRDDLILTEKEFPSSGRKAKTESEALARDHLGAWKTFLKGSEMEEEEEQEKRENKDEIVSFSKQGIKVWERSSLLRNSTEIRPEAPTFIEQNDLSEAPIPTTRKEEKEHLFGGNHYRESSSSQTDGYYSMEQDFLPEEPGIKGDNEGRERPFSDEDRHKEAPETKMRDESRQSLIDGESQPKEELKKEQPYLSIGQDDPREAPEIKRLDEIEERLFGNEGQSNCQTEEYLSGEVCYLEGASSTMRDQREILPFKGEGWCPEVCTRHELNTRGTDLQERFHFKKEGWQHTLFILKRIGPGILKTHQNEQDQERKRDSFWQAIRMTMNTIQEEKRPQLARCGTEIRPEAPILRTELPRDDFVLPDKEFPPSGRDAKTEPKAPTFIEQNEERESSSIEPDDPREASIPTTRKEEKEHLFDGNHYRELWSYQAEAPTFISQNEKSERPFIGQDFSSEGSEMEEEEEQEKRENKDEIVSFSKQGTKVWERSSLLRNSTEIRPEAPTFIEQNEERESSSIEPDDPREAPIPIVRKEEKEHLFGGNHYRELWSYQMDGYYSMEQDFLPEAPGRLPSSIKREKERLDRHSHAYSRDLKHPQYTEEGQKIHGTCVTVGGRKERCSGDTARDLNEKSQAVRDEARIAFEALKPREFYQGNKLLLRRKRGALKPLKNRTTGRINMKLNHKNREIENNLETCLRFSKESKKSETKRFEMTSLIQASGDQSQGLIRIKEKR